MARILMVASEAAPFAKTGGLADVIAALPKALRQFGHEVAVVIPRYGGIDTRSARWVYHALPIWLGPDRYDTSVFLHDGEVPFYLLDCPPLYGRPELYGEDGNDYPDNPVRFAVLARGALEICRRIFRPDLLHCHDWQAGLVPVYLHSTFDADPTFLGIRTLFTIHNLGYQGLCPATEVGKLALDRRLLRPEGLEFWGRLNFMKGGLVFSDALNTVSPTYAREILTPEYGFGLDGVLRSRADALTGILNGVDYCEWNPELDRHIPARYSADDLEGKSVCKRELIREFGLAEDALERPLVGVVSRLAAQKGSDLIAAAAAAFPDLDMYLVVLGTGEPEYEQMFHNLAQSHPGRISVRIGYDNPLAHRIEAGSDIFLMPSRYEPCGLNQIYSLRYGTLPIVRATGGLDDTIEEDTGFKFTDYSVEALLSAVQAASKAFGGHEHWTERMRRSMRKNFSWRRSAQAYSELYARLLARV